MGQYCGVKDKSAVQAFKRLTKVKNANMIITDWIGCESGGRAVFVLQNNPSLMNFSSRMDLHTIDRKSI